MYRYVYTYVIYFLLVLLISWRICFPIASRAWDVVGYAAWSCSNGKVLSNACCRRGVYRLRKHHLETAGICFFSPSVMWMCIRIYLSVKFVLVCLSWYSWRVWWWNAVKSIGITALWYGDSRTRMLQSCAAINHGRCCVVGIRGVFFQSSTRRSFAGMSWWVHLRYPVKKPREAI